MRCLFIVTLAVLTLFSSQNLLAADDQGWPAHGRTDDEQRHSPLDLINQDNVGELGLTWSFATGNVRGMEATPIVVGNTMYVSTAWSRVVALHAKTGKKIWFFDPQVAGEKGRDACCDVVNRGVAVLGEQVFVGTIDGRLIALDRTTGKPNWSVQTTRTDKPYTITGAPRVMDGKVIIGNGGAEFGVRGYFSAYDPADGSMLWRFYTVPSQDSAEDAQQPSLRKARSTWSPESRWETGLGGTVWDSFAYDETLNLIYAGVGNASQYNRAVRSPGGGDNLFVSSIVAVHADTGRLAWHFQTTPADSWDYTATQHMILAQLDILGDRRKVIMQAPKNGFFYVLDRATGELISAKNYVPVNWASHVDLESGRPIETDIADWSSNVRTITPAIFGGHNWHPMTFSPDTGLVYIPTIHAAYRFETDPDYTYDPKNFNTGENMAGIADSLPPFIPQFCSPTRLTAWNPLTQETSWEVSFDSGVSAGLLSTGGGLIFQGTTTGELVAYADTSGERLWGQQVNVGIMAPPVTYTVDGEQYVAVVAGIGGAQGGHMTVLSHNNPGHVFAFKLNGSAPPPQPGARDMVVHATDAMLDEDMVSRGGELYGEHCMRCHGVMARSSGVYPDLRHSSAEIHEIWQQIVRDGVFSAKGMAGFKDSLSVEDVNAVHSYVISQAITSDSWMGKIAEGIGNAVCIPARWMAD